MSRVSCCHEPGLLVVFIRPKSSQYLRDFHEWYNTEHGPARMKLDFIKTGYRYRTTDSGPTTWAGIYDLDRVSAVTESQYINLRKHRSAREKDVMNNKLSTVDRKIYRLVSSRGRRRNPAPVIFRSTFVVKSESLSAFRRWYEKKHLDELSRIPGWQSSRGFEILDDDTPDSGCVEYMAMHEFDDVDGTRASEHVAAVERKPSDLIESCSSMQLGFYHEFKAQDYVQPPEPNLASRTWASQRLAGVSDMHTGASAIAQQGLGQVSITHGVEAVA